VSLRFSVDEMRGPMFVDEKREHMFADVDDESEPMFV